MGWGRKRRFTPNERELRLMEAYAAGRTLKAIAESEGVSVTAVRSTMIRGEVRLMLRYRIMKPYQGGLNEEMAELYGLGVKPRIVVKRLLTLWAIEKANEQLSALHELWA